MFGYIFIGVVLINKFVCEIKFDSLFYLCIFKFMVRGELS